jgi:hypothetical protein
MPVEREIVPLVGTAAVTLVGSIAYFTRVC